MGGPHGLDAVLPTRVPSVTVESGPTCDVCGSPADEVALGVYVRHTACVRLVASRSAAAEVEVRWAAAAEGPQGGPQGRRAGRRADQG